MNPLHKSPLTSPTSLVAVFLLLGVCLSVAAQEDDTSVESLMLSGRAYYETQDYPKAAARFERICAVEPDNVEATIMAARSYWNAGDKEAARAKWETYLELEPDGEMKEEAEAALRRSVAILNFSTGGDLAHDRQNAGSTFADTITTRLAAVPDIDIVERTQVSRLLGEQRFQNQGWTDPRFAQEFGRVINAEYLIIGNVFKEGQIFQATARVISTATGRVEGEGVVVTAASLIDLMSKTASSLLLWWGYEAPQAQHAPDEGSAPTELDVEDVAHLIRLLPQGTEFEELEAAEEEVERAYFLGINYLRHGLTRRSAFWVNQALGKFNIVVNQAPALPQGHFHSGLCSYYLRDYRDAQFAFIEAVKLDDELWEHCPLLYYDDCGPDWPLVPTHASRKYTSPIDGYVRFQPEIKPEELAVWPQSILLKDRRVLNLSVAVSFRFHGSHGHPSQPWIGLRARAHESGGRGREYLQAALRVNGEVHLRSVAHPGGAYDHRVLDAREVGISRNKWYRLRLDLLEGEYRISINGHPVLENIGTPNPALVVPGALPFAAFAAAGNTIDVDDLCVTRLYSD